MKSYRTLKNFIVAMLLLVTTSMTHADELSGHIGILLGAKVLNSSDWPDLDRHNVMGYIFDIKKGSWPISIVLDIMDTGGKHKHDGMEDLGHTTEFRLGARKTFINPRLKIQPYIGGGVSFMYAEQEFEVNNITTVQDDTEVGGWFGGGIYYEINPSFVVGLDVRYSNGTVTLFNKERDAGGTHFGVTGSYQF